jgi:prepilin-type N-terminal cleavage/methylation domain-containing protein
MMINKKGFSLMELLVALFIGGMVTIALVSVWRSASMQTSQGQRQAIVRNNFSIFMRQFIGDLTEADVILYPSKSISAVNNVVLVGAYNAKRTKSGVAPARYAFGDSTYFYYCKDGENIRKVTGNLDNNFIFEEGDTPTYVPDYKNIGSFLNTIATADNCSNGIKVMDNVSDASVTSAAGGRYKVDISIFKHFTDGVPVSINFENIFVPAGGADYDD